MKKFLIVLVRASGKFEILFTLLIKDAINPDKGDIQVKVDGKNYNMEVKDARGKISAIDGCGKIENIKEFSRQLKTRAYDFSIKLFEKLKPDGIRGDKDKESGNKLIEEAKEQFPVTNKNNAYITLNSRSVKPNITFNSFITVVKNLFFKTAQLIEGEGADLNEIKSFYNNVDNNIDKEFNDFLSSSLNHIFNTVINGAYGNGGYEEIIDEYIESYYSNNQEPGVDIYGLTQVMGMKMLEKYKNNDGFRYFLVCNSGTNEAAIFDLDSQVNREKISSLIEFTPPAITSGSAIDAAFGVKLKK